MWILARRHRMSVCTAAAAWDAALRAARKQAGLTQAEAAAQAGLTRESLSLIENGQRSAHLETINAMA